MERTLLSWNLPNIVTVTLMAALGYALLAAVTQIVLRRQPNAAATSTGSF